MREFAGKVAVVTGAASGIGLALARKFGERGIEVIAERVVEAIREERFYILSEDVWRRCCEVRLEDLRQARNPTFALPVDEGVG